jgi:hypothetical protein
MLLQREFIERGGKKARHRLGKYTRFREFRKFDMVQAIVRACDLPFGGDTT